MGYCVCSFVCVLPLYIGEGLITYIRKYNYENLILYRIFQTPEETSVQYWLSKKRRPAKKIRARQFHIVHYENIYIEQGNLCKTSKLLIVELVPFKEANVQISMQTILKVTLSRRTLPYRYHNHGNNHFMKSTSWG